MVLRINLTSGRIIIGGILNFTLSVVTVKYPLYLSPTGELVIPSEVHIREIDIPVESIENVTEAPGNVISDYGFFASTLMMGNAVVNKIHSEMLLSKDSTSEVYSRFFASLEKQTPSMN